MRLKSALFLLLVLIISVTVWLWNNDTIVVLNPKGMIGLQQKNLIWTATWLMCIVVVPVFFMLGFFAWRYRANNPKAKYTPDWAHSHLAEILWWGVPLIIIVFLAVITWTSSHRLDPYKPIASEKKPLTIQVVALNWKWLFIYPEQGIATVNYVQLPEHTPLAFEITGCADEFVLDPATGRTNLCDGSDEDEVAFNSERTGDIPGLLGEYQRRRFFRDGVYGKGHDRRGI